MKNKRRRVQDDSTSGVVAFGTAPRAATWESHPAGSCVTYCSSEMCPTIALVQPLPPSARRRMECPQFYQLIVRFVTFIGHFCCLR